MSLKLKHAFAWMSLLVLHLLSGAVTAQMRPECGADPTKPGACFVELDNSFFNAAINCGAQLPTNDNLNEGVFVWVGIQGENDFRRFNPDGTQFIHQSDDEVIDAAYCIWQSIFSGTCGGFGAPGPAAFLGNASIQVNGVTSAGGAANCPFVLTGSGKVTRSSDGKTIEVSPRLHLVPGPNGGCKIQQCEFLKRGKKNDS